VESDNEVNHIQNANNDSNHHQQSQQVQFTNPTTDFRSILSTSVKNIIKVAALSGVSALYIPFDVYSPIEEGFGTRDFVTLVRDTRATIIEIIASQRQKACKHQLKCIRFVKSHKQLNDDALTSSLISVLKEQFASDVYHENA
jgi:hypothetical protein